MNGDWDAGDPRGRGSNNRFEVEAQPQHLHLHQHQSQSQSQYQHQHEPHPERQQQPPSDYNHRYHSHDAHSHAHDHQHNHSHEQDHHHATNGHFFSSEQYHGDLLASQAIIDDDATSPSVHHAFASVNPDSFYKSYQALQSDSTPDSLPMASSSVPRPPLRSNGDTTTKRPFATSNRVQTRPSNVRSVSTPVDSKAATASSKPGVSNKPSVKDLRKRFDQNNEGGQSALPRATSRPPANSRTKDSSVSSYSALRSGSSQETPTLSPQSQRSRFVPEDQVSSNTQSFASRVGKPRPPASGNPNAPRSTTHLSPKPSAPPVPLLHPDDLPSQGLLFGEILPEQYDTSALGFGIESIRPREASSASDAQAHWAHQRSLSDPDVEPSSPTRWYRSANEPDNGPNLESEPAPRRHGRSLSDASSQKPAQTVARKPATRKPTASTQQPSASKLPLSVKKINGSAESSSPPSTRSNSPSVLKRPAVNGRTSRAGTPTARAKTPTSRAKTPTQPTSGRKAAPPSLPTPNSSSRLQAYVAAPPPKLSPPLRSSRPRQPVSMATTASSRSKAVDRTKLTNSTYSTAAAGSKKEDSATRRRKISVGPIDFEQRREHIRLAYSKSLRESQALETRKKAAEQRKKEMEAAAEAKAAQEAALAAEAAAIAEAVASEVRETAADVPDALRTSPPLPEMGTVNDPEDSGEVRHDHSMEDHRLISNIDAAANAPLTLVTGSPIRAGAANLPIILALDSVQPAAEVSFKVSDSPTLGVPGSFPAMSPPMDSEETPPSAVSATTVTTEFDVEPQTNPPVAPQSPVEVPITIVKPPSPQTVDSARQRAEYQYPFEDERKSPETPATSQDTVQDLHYPAVNTDNAGPAIPGAFRDDDEDDTCTTHTESICGTSVTDSPSFDEDVRRDEQVTTSVPFPRLEMQDESDCQSDLDDTHDPIPSVHLDHEYAATDDGGEDMDDLSKNDDCQSVSHCDEGVSSYRASSCASSDAGGSEDLHSVADQQAADDTPNNLLVPQSIENRASHQSAWTDYTIETNDHSDGVGSPEVPEEESPTFGHVTIFGSQVLSRDSDPASRDSCFDSPRVRPSYDSAASINYLHPNQLPEVEAGEDFTISYLTDRQSIASPYMPSPDHEPPPVPTPTSGSVGESRPVSSAFYEQSQYGSTPVHSGHGSDDFASQLQTPQTIDTNSFETGDQYFGVPSQADSDIKALGQNGDELTGRERQRLVQRRNVIKELIDTEAVFVRDMNIVEEIYKGTAEACPRLDSKTVKIIFRNTNEIISFHTEFLAQVKAAVASVYVPKTGRSPASGEDVHSNEPAPLGPTEISEDNDRATALGPVFMDKIKKMKTVHESFLRSSDQAAKRLIQIQQDPTVMVWLNECNEVAKELTAAWNLDSLLIKPMQRITKYPNLIITLLQHTPQDHPDRDTLMSAKDNLETAIVEINKTKKNFELVGQIVGRKRKDSDVKAGFARAFGKRVDKLQTPGTKIPEDPEYAKLNEKFGDDYLRLQVVLRDVEFYTRQVTAYVREFLQYLSSIELVMRLQPGSYPELESKWVQFNISVRDLEKIALEDHLAQVRKHVIEPFELVIKAYGNPSLAMKKRQKRRIDFERWEQLKRAGKSGDTRLNEQVEHYEALNDTLKKELPKLSALTEKIGNICLGNFVNIQANWFKIWRDKMKTVLNHCPDKPDLQEVVTSFQRDFPYAQEQVASIGMLNPVAKSRPSQSTTMSGDDAVSRTRSRPSDVDTTRSRNPSINDDVPSLPTPDFVSRTSGSFTTSPTSMAPGTAMKGIPSPHQYYYRDYYAGLNSQSVNPSSATTLEAAGSSRSAMATTAASTRPSTGRSFDSGGMPRQSLDSTSQHRRDSNTTYGSNYPPHDNRRFSGIFHSALPLADGPEESRRPSRASSRERGPSNDGYNVLWVAASLFEFNIATTKHEAGYPYLVYQASEIFDVIAEKGELWLAKNQDDPAEQVGWIWSKHFAKLADP